MSKLAAYFASIGLLSGAIIGAGIFSLPAAFNIGGLGIGLIYLLMGVLVYSLVYAMYGDVILMTPGEHRFVGFVKYYFGKFFSGLAVVMAIVQSILVLTIYLILSVSFVRLVFPELSEIAAVLIFWAVGSAVIFLSLKRLIMSEFLITAGIILIVGIIFFLGFFSGMNGLVNLGQVPKFGSGLALLLPLPIVLFSFGGRAAIVSLVRNFQQKRGFLKFDDYKLLKKTIIVAVMVPAIVYVFFVLGVLAISPAVSDDAISGIKDLVSPIILLLIGALGLFSLWSSYFVNGLNINESLGYDLKFAKLARVFLVVLAPLMLYFWGLRDFLGLIGFIGGVFLSLEGIMIILLFFSAKKRNKAGPFLVKQNWFLYGFLAGLVFLTAFLSVTFLN
jgi:amino acid permease